MVGMCRRFVLWFRGGVLNDRRAAATVFKGSNLGESSQRCRWELPGACVLVETYRAGERSAGKAVDAGPGHPRVREKLRSWLATQRQAPKEGRGRRRRRRGVGWVLGEPEAGRRGRKKREPGPAGCSLVIPPKKIRSRRRDPQCSTREAVEQRPHGRASSTLPKRAKITALAAPPTPKVPNAGPWTRRAPRAWATASPPPEPEGRIGALIVPTIETFSPLACLSLESRGVITREREREGQRWAPSDPALLLLLLLLERDGLHAVAWLLRTHGRPPGKVVERAAQAMDSTTIKARQKLAACCLLLARPVRPSVCRSTAVCAAPDHDIHSPSTTLLHSPWTRRAPSEPGHHPTLHQRA